MAYLLYRKDMHLLIEPDFMISILRVKFCCIAHDNEGIQNLDNYLKTVGHNKIK